MNIWRKWFAWRPVVVNGRNHWMLWLEYNGSEYRIPWIDRRDRYFPPWDEMRVP